MIIPLSEDACFKQQKEANKVVKQQKEELSSVRNDKGQLMGRSEVVEQTMTRCADFYEKVKKDGNFCGMREDKFVQLLEYLEYREGVKPPTGVLSEGAWLKSKSKQAEVAKHKTERFVGTENQTELVETEWIITHRYLVESYPPFSCAIQGGINIKLKNA